MNQDGRTPGITLPSMKAQQTLIEDTYRQAGLDVSETDFFEAHGTGTQAGDRTEAESPSRVLRTFASSHNSVGAWMLASLFYSLIVFVLPLLSCVHGCSGGPRLSDRFR